MVLQLRDAADGDAAQTPKATTLKDARAVVRQSKASPLVSMLVPATCYVRCRFAISVLPGNPWPVLSAPSRAFAVAGGTFDGSMPAPLGMPPCPGRLGPAWATPVPRAPG